jgi:hypothetical protein
VLCDPAGRHVKVRTPNSTWEPLHAARLEPQSGTEHIGRMSDENVARFLRRIVDEATAEHPDTLLLTHAQNSRSTWRFIANRHLTADALGLGTGSVPPYRALAGPSARPRTHK